MIILKKYGLSLLLAPKGASTWLKHMAFEIENDRPFKPFRSNSEFWHIHLMYPLKLFGERQKQIDWSKDVFAVIRDPVERILSCHSNRVLHHGEIDRLDLTEEDKEKGIVERPDFETFVEHLQRYKELNYSMNHHSRPLVDWFWGAREQIHKSIRLRRPDRVKG